MRWNRKPSWWKNSPNMDWEELWSWKENGGGSAGFSFFGFWEDEINVTGREGVLVEETDVIMENLITQLICFPLWVHLYWVNWYSLNVLQQLIWSN